MRGSHGRLGSNWQDPLRAVILEEEEEEEKDTFQRERAQLLPAKENPQREGAHVLPAKETLQRERAQVLSAKFVPQLALVLRRAVLVAVRLTNLGPLKHLELSSNAAT